MLAALAGLAVVATVVSLPIDFGWPASAVAMIPINLLWRTDPKTKPPVLQSAVEMGLTADAALAAKTTPLVNDLAARLPGTT